MGITPSRLLRWLYPGFELMPPPEPSLTAAPPALQAAKTVSSPGADQKAPSGDSEAATQPTPGTWLGSRTTQSEIPVRFEDRGLIAEGGMGTVRVVYDVVLRREVAMKTLRPCFAAGISWLNSFVEEAQITAQLNHPSVVPIHDLAIDNAGNAYFTMKLIHGRTLLDLLRDPEKSLGSSARLAELLEILIKVCDALAFAHSRGVVHCDIKPGNIMVGEFGEVYVMDWGVARIKETSAVDVVRGSELSGSSSGGGLVGTPSYMSPEQAGGFDAAVDERSDIFSLGAVLYHIVTGIPPYGSDGEQGTILKARKCQFTPPDEVRDVYVPKFLRAVLGRALARDPKERYQSATELKQHLRRFMHGGLYLPRQTFAAGEQIVREGEPGDRAYLITQGYCNVYKMIGEERRFIRRMEAGTVFGETAVLSNTVRTATVEAVDEVTVVVLDRSVIEQGLGSDTWESQLVRALVERFREIDARVTELEREKLEGGATPPSNR